MIKFQTQETYAANGYTGDGETLAAMAQSNSTSLEAGTGVAAMQGTQNVFGAWLMVAAVLIGVMLLAEKFSVGQTFGNVKIGFYNMLVITIYAVLGISLGKVFFAKVKVPGVSVLFTSV